MTHHLTRHRITEDEARAANMASHHAADLARYLMQVADGEWLSPPQHGLRAEWAFDAFDRLLAEMAKISRPQKEEEAA